MRLEVLDDSDAVAHRALALIAAHRPAGPGTLWAFPTGGTPQPLYRLMAEAVARGEWRWPDVRLVTLDEYLGADPAEPRSLRGWLGAHLLQPTGFPPERLLAFDALAADPDAEAARIEAQVRAAGGLDLLVLGLGRNGHLGFNEPGSPLDGNSHVVTLTPDSIDANAAHWGGPALVPGRAITLGLGTFATARSVLVLVTGRAKAAILARALEGPVGPGVPASWLQGRANVTILADRAAASALRPS
jgi:glucosamine-6-phosphate deaminase